MKKTILLALFSLVIFAFGCEKEPLLVPAPVVGAAGGEGDEVTMKETCVLFEAHIDYLIEHSMMAYSDGLTALEYLNNFVAAIRLHNATDARIALNNLRNHIIFLESVDALVEPYPTILLGFCDDLERGMRGRN